MPSRYPNCDSQTQLLTGPLWLDRSTAESGFRGVVEFAVARAVEEALPLVPVEHQHPLIRIAGHAHQHPAAVSDRVGERVGERDLDRAVTAAGASPDLRGEVDAELGDRGLGGHGFRATPQYSQRAPSLSARTGSSAPQTPV